ncbi:hypothetical protein NM688_g1114 [Phlebia brevispora]|uniref:Uncharacterized protein n=1 Tax=Phlebia brevispora TaxID=194682 RepID=A0ACC1TC76_9APHY|nr:hypothetical protein NM688_g1114 [Phlebia brevispora]
MSANRKFTVESHLASPAPQVIDRSSAFTITNNFPSELTLIQDIICEKCRWDIDANPQSRINSGETSRPCKVVPIKNSSANPAGTMAEVTYIARVDGRQIVCHFHVACPVDDWNIAVVHFSPVDSGHALIKDFNYSSNPLKVSFTVST